MAKILNGLILPDGTRWTNELSYQPVRQSKKSTIGGGWVITAQTLHKGQPINLVFGEGQAWLNYAQVKMILNWAKSPSDTFVFQWYLETNVVMFDHEQQAHEFFPVEDYNETELNHYYGNINLITV